MSYYIQTIEQIIKDNALAEYGTIEKITDEQLAYSKFYKKLSDVSASIGKAHTFMDIKILNSVGGIIKKDSIGTYQTEVPVVETETETEE